jgi:pyruvate formate lyase activating enzyme
MCKWIHQTLGPDYPVHFSRFGPHYKLRHLPSTAPSKLIAARDVAMEEGLRYVYVGNYRTPDGAGSNTFCPSCGKTVIERMGYMITKYDVKDGACAHCGTPIAGRWKVG